MESSEWMSDRNLEIYAEKKEKREYIHQFTHTHSPRSSAQRAPEGNTTERNPSPRGARLHSANLDGASRLSRQRSLQAECVQCLNGRHERPDQLLRRLAPATIDNHVRLRLVTNSGTAAYIV